MPNLDATEDRSLNTPQPPPTPSPYAVAAAQQNSNISTAIANTVMMNANEIHPQGTVNYSNTGSYALSDPQYDDTGALTGTTVRTIPVYTRSVLYTTAEQGVYASELATRQQMATTALAQAGRINTNTATSVSTAGLTTVTASPAVITLTGHTAPGNFRDTELVAPAAMPSAAAAQALPSAPSSPTLPTSLATPSMPAAIVAPNLPAAPAVVTITTSVPTAPVLEGMVPDAGPVWDVIGSSDFATAKQTVIDAVKARLEYQRGLDLTSTLARLTNSGILAGSEAYEAELRIFNFRATDETNQAVLAGGQEQSRLFQLEMARAQHYNGAQQQRFTQNTLIIEIGNRAEVQSFEWGATAARTANEFAMLSLQAEMQQKDAATNLLLKEFGADLQAAEFSRSLAVSTTDVTTRINEHNAGLLLKKLEADLSTTQMTSRLALEAYQMAQQTADQTAKFRGIDFAQQLKYDTEYNAAITQDFMNIVNYRKANNEYQIQQMQALIALGDYQRAQRERELQEQLTVRNQPINEVTTLMRGSHLALPQFKQYQAGTIANTPIGEYIYRSAELDWKKYDTEVKNQAAMIGAVGSIAGAGIGAPAGGWLSSAFGGAFASMTGANALSGQ